MLSIIVPAVMLPVIVLMILTPTAYANNAAIVINGLGCALFDGNGGIASSDITHAVVTNNGHGVFTCKASVDPSSTGHAVKYDAYNNPLNITQPCEVDQPTYPYNPYFITTDWHETVSADGQAIIVCHGNP